MSVIRFRGASYALDEGELVLDRLVREGVDVPHSCRSGICQSCMLRAAKGTLPPSCQEGIRETHRERGYFLACQCAPTGDLEIDDGDASQAVPAKVLELEDLGAGAVRVRIVPDQPFEWRAGQFIHLVRNSDGLTRPYSAASRPQDRSIELHVRRVANGRMSQWIHDELRPGDPVTLRGPCGECFYVAGRPDQPMLLAGVGTGLAPLWGILHDALALGHQGRIVVVQGGLSPDRLYLHQELTELAAQHPQVQYVPCALKGDAPGVLKGGIGDVIQTQQPDLSGYRAFLCGDPGFVAAARRQVFLDGVASQEIHADPFVTAPPQSKPQEAKSKQ